MTVTWQTCQHRKNHGNCTGCREARQNEDEYWQDDLYECWLRGHPDCWQRGDPHVISEYDEYITFWGEIGECPCCHASLKELVYLERNYDFDDKNGGLDCYKCPCGASITFGVTHPLGMCYWGA